MYIKYIKEIIKHSQSLLLMFLTIYIYIYIVVAALIKFMWIQLQ